MQRHNTIPCCVCEGTGRTTPDHPHDPSGRTWPCHGGCNDGYFDAEPRDLIGRRARHGHVIGTLEVWDTALCLFDDEHDLWVVNLDPLTVELIS